MGGYYDHNPGIYTELARETEPKKRMLYHVSYMDNGSPKKITFSDPRSRDIFCTGLQAIIGSDYNITEELR
jgi:hypothetical protein